ncbi:MAG TPA: N-acetylmuramoyl-L-alanine amidase [Myxococcales bacterium]
MKLQLQVVNDRWAKRGASSAELDDGVSYVAEQWEIPGESPLTVRFCTRKGHPMSSFCHMQETPKRAVVLHHTSGLGHLGTLMGDRGFISIHFMIGRDGNVYRFVNTEYKVNHAPPFSTPTVGIEVDNLGKLLLKDGILRGEAGTPYCKVDEKEAYVEKQWRSKNEKYWATWTEAQYVGVGKLLKAICHKHQIPKMILPEEHRFEAFDEQRDIPRFRGVCHHVNINYGNRDDLGPYVDWDKIISYAGLSVGDCFNNPAEGGAPAKKPAQKPEKKPEAPKKQDAPKKQEPARKAEPAAPPVRAEDPPEPLPAPVQVDARTVRLRIGPRPGRIAFSVRKQGEPLPTSPATSAPSSPTADGKRDEFLRAAMSFLAVPYKAGSNKPDQGLDGPGLIGLCLKRVGAFKAEDEVTAAVLAGLYPPSGSDPQNPPAEIVPGDLAWFGSGDHDRASTQHPMISLGGGRLLGPLAQGGKDHGAVQVVHIQDVPDHFAGWSHLDDLGMATAQTQHPGDPPAAGTQLTAALLPSEPAERYEALKKVVGDRGGKWKSGKGEVNLIGIQDLQDLCYRSPNRGGWNDTLFACFVDQDGNKLSLELRSSLNPGHDEDPKGAWNLCNGSYSFKLADGQGGSKQLVPEGKIKGWCDTPGRGAPPPQEGPPQPGDALCTPALRMLPQWDGRWDDEILHDSKASTWQNSGCHPCSVAEVLRWIAEDNPATAGKFGFPAAPDSRISADKYPLRMCEAFWPELRGEVKATKPGDPKNSKVDHTALGQATERVLGMAKDARKVSLGKDRVAGVKKALARGPLVVCMPGHFVVIQGIADGKLLIVDPGNVLLNHWEYADGGAIEKGKGMPANDRWEGGKPAGNERDSRGYVQVAIDRKIKKKAPTQNKKETDEAFQKRKEEFDKSNDPIKFLDGISSPESYWWAGGG